LKYSEILQKQFVIVKNHVDPNNALQVLPACVMDKILKRPQQITVCPDSNCYSMRHGPIRKSKLTCWI